MDGCVAVVVAEAVTVAAAVAVAVAVAAIWVPKVNVLYEAV